MKRQLTTCAALALLSTAALAQTNNEVQGTNAGTAITTGDNNAIFGDEAGAALATGSGNVFFGYNAGNATTNSENVYVGNQAGSLMTTGVDNVFIGDFAGSSYVMELDNVLIGGEACRDCTDTASGFGDSPFPNPTSSGGNTMIGSSVARLGTTVEQSTFIGESAGLNAGWGFDNVGVGSDACYRCGEDGGSMNAAVGFQALYSSQTGWKNTALGAVAGSDNRHGYLNTFIGAQSGARSEQADFNTFVGVWAGASNDQNSSASAEATIPSNANTAVGVLALSTKRSGSNNTVVGALADSANVDSPPSDIQTYVINQDLDTTSSSSTRTTDGSGADLTVENLTLLGAVAYSRGDDSVTIGYSAETGNNPRSITIGATAESYHTDAFTLGYGAVSHAAETFIFGNSAVTAVTPGTNNATALGHYQTDCVGVDCGGSGPDQDYTFDAANTYRFKHVYANALKAVATDGNLWSIAAADGNTLQFLSSSDDSSFSSSISFSGDGDLTVPDEININSDRRLKTNIQRISNALDTIAKLEGKTYQWREETGRDQDTHLGFIAQDVEKVLPELVSQDENGIRSVNYLELLPYLVESVKELTTENEQLELETQLLLKELDEINLLLDEQEQIFEYAIRGLEE